MCFLIFSPSRPYPYTIRAYTANKFKTRFCRISALFLHRARFFFSSLSKWIIHPNTTERNHTRAHTLKGTVAKFSFVRGTVITRITSGRTMREGRAAVGASVHKSFPSTGDCQFSCEILRVLV